MTETGNASSDGVSAEAAMSPAPATPVPASSAPPARGSGADNAWAVAFSVSLAAFMEVLDTTITNVSLQHIAGSLGASQDESTWVLTSYLVANGIVLPLSGWLSEVLGRKRYFMLSIGAFTLASFACGAATSLTMLICFRLLQGIAGGGLQPVQQSIILDAFPPEKRGQAFAVTGITMIVAPILGPTLGGWITDNYSWRWIFYLNIPVGIFALWLVNMNVQDPANAKAKGFKSVDYIGLALVVIGLGCLQIVLDKGQQDDWFGSAFIRTYAVISGCALAGAVGWLLTRKDPIIDLRLLGKRSFGLSCIMIFCVGLALYAGSALLPLLTQTEFGYNATLAGLVLSPGGFVVIVGMPTVGRLVGKIQARYLAAFGFALCAWGMYATSYITPDDAYHNFVWFRIQQVLGLPFMFIPISTMAFTQIPKESSNKASALYALARNIGGSIGIACINSYTVRQAQMHQAVLGYNLTPSNTYYRGLISTFQRGFFDLGRPRTQAHGAAFNRVYYELLHQSTILAYDDAFRLMAVIMAALVFVALLLPANKPGAKAGAAAAAAH